MNKKKVYIIGQFPPPVHGLSVALQTIIRNERMNNLYELDYVDIKNNKKFLRHIERIYKTQADIFYFTISQSKFGNLRDLFILGLVLFKRKKVVIHYHGGYFKKLYQSMNYIQKKINRTLLSKIDTMIVLSEGLRELFTDIIVLEKLRVCENYIEDSNLINSSEFMRKLDTMKCKDKIEVLYLSNFIKSKGYMDVLEAAKRLKGEEFIFHFAGSFFSEEDNEQFLKEIERSKLQKNVIYHGSVTGEAKRQLLMNSDIFVLPTYYPNEGQPISIIEAMGNGLTVVTTRHAGIPDIVNENNGYFVNQEAPEEISQVLIEVAKDREKLLEFGQTNRRIVLEKFMESHYIERLQAIFNEVLQK